MRDFTRDQWALILGGSSGMGLATADKLSRHGMSVCVVHRDRKGAMARIQPSFDEIAARVPFRAYNLDALSPEGRDTVLAGLAEAMGEAGRVRVLLHSIAFANLRLVAPTAAGRPPARAREALAAALGIDAERVGAAVATLFAEGDPAFLGLADGAAYGDNLLEDEDLTRTVHAMGTSLITWVQALLGRKLFAADARVLGLTSEGNRIAWRGYAAAAAAKAALESAARAIAVECAPHGLRCNIVQAGVTRTPALALIPGSQHIIAASLARNPMGRLTTPEDVAGLICLLATDEAAWVNGALVCCDGGEHLG
jgi:NAD(P)-dependent dehydrogenase (short-subunit alcohol dehydrogenase family)